LMQYLAVSSVRCSVLQCVAVCCICEKVHATLLQYVAGVSQVFAWSCTCVPCHTFVLQCVAGVLQCVAGVLQVCHRFLHGVANAFHATRSCCSMLQVFTVCCRCVAGVLQCVAATHGDANGFTSHTSMRHVGVHRCRDAMTLLKHCNTTL